MERWRSSCGPIRPSSARSISTSFSGGLLVCILLGNNDAHSKNFALLYTEQGFRLGPFYDIVAPSVYPRFRRTGWRSRSRRGRIRIRSSDIGPKHLSLLAKSFGLNHSSPAACSVGPEATDWRGARSDPGVEGRQHTFEEAVDRSDGEAMERNVRLNWEVIVRQARDRRKERGLTQRHLAALANVGRSTLNRFENQSGDVTLSSVLRILGVLDMLDRKQEGTLRLKASETRDGIFDVTFTPTFGGEPAERKTLTSRESLERFLSDLGVPQKRQKRAMGEIQRRGSGLISSVLVSKAEMEENWSKS